MDERARTADIAARIAEHTRPFAEIWTDGRGAVAAVSRHARADVIVALRPDSAPTLFRDGEGRIRAAVGRGWAMCLRAPGTYAYQLPAVADLAGRIGHREIPRVHALVRECRAERVATAGSATARLLAAMLGPECVEIAFRPDPFALALLRSGGQVGVAVVAAPPRSGLRGEVPIDEAARRLARVEEWGAPPPGEGTALEAYARVLLDPWPWRTGPHTSITGTRADLVQALRAWSDGFPSWRVALDDGSTWEVRSIPMRKLPSYWGIHAIAFPAPPDPWARRQVERPLRVSRERDVAVVANTLYSAFLGRGCEPLLYGALAREVREAHERSAMAEWMAVAITLPAAEIHRAGPTIVLDGVYVPYGRLPEFFPLVA